MDAPIRQPARLGLLLLALAGTGSPLAAAGSATGDPPPLAPVQEPAPTDPAPMPLVVSVAAGGAFRGGS